MTNTTDLTTLPLGSTFVSGDTTWTIQEGYASSEDGEARGFQGFNSSTLRDFKVAPVVGDLATMSINGDSYVVIIDKVTPKTITVLSTVKDGDEYVEVPYSDPRVFRWNEKRQTYVYRQYFHLTLGMAVERRDPSF